MGRAVPSAKSTLSSQQELSAVQGHLAKGFPFIFLGSTVPSGCLPLHLQSWCQLGSTGEMERRQLLRTLLPPKAATVVPLEGKDHKRPVIFSKQRRARGQMTRPNHHVTASHCTSEGPFQGAGTPVFQLHQTSQSIPESQPCGNFGEGLILFHIGLYFTVKHLWITGTKRLESRI